MGWPTREQQRESQRRAHARRELVDGRLIATERPASDHGKPWVATYFGCQCDPCRASVVHNVAENRAGLRRAHLARRILIGSKWVAAHIRDEQHGTPSASDYYGCQCPTCVDAARERRCLRRLRTGK